MLFFSPASTSEPFALILANPTLPAPPSSLLPNHSRRALRISRSGDGKEKKRRIPSSYAVVRLLNGGVCAGGSSMVGATLGAPVHADD